MKLADKIAKIIHDGVVSGDSSWDEMATKILTTMREPTAAMMLAHSGRSRSSLNGVGHLDAEAIQAWQAMIDAALRE